MPHVSDRAGARTGALRLAAGATVVFAMFYPTIWMVMSAFKNNRELFRSPFGLPGEWRWSNFVAAWQQANLGTLYVNSLIVTLSSSLIVLFAATAAAYGFSRLKFRGSEACYRTLLIGLLLPPPVVAIPLFAQLRDMALLNTLWALILPGAAWAMSMSTFIMRSFVDALKPDTEEGARIDGAGAWQVFWRIVMPQVRPAMLTVGVLNAINIWNELLFAMLFVSDESQRTLPAGLIKFYGFHSTDYALVFAALTISVVPIFVLYFFMQKQVVAGLTAIAMD